VIVAVGRVSVVTVSSAARVVALPNELVTTQSKVAPVSARVTFGRVYVADVAPMMVCPFRRHW
jgi:hypothetical protein